MKFKILSIALISFLLMNACVSVDDFKREEVEGNGTVVKKSRETADFSEIDISENIVARIKKANEHTLVVKTDANLHKYIVTEVNGNTLDIHVKDNYGLDPTEKTEVFITFEELEKIEASSGSEVHSESKFVAEELEIDVSSDAYVDLETEAREITGDCSSGSSIKLKGKAEKCRLDVSSGGDISMKDLICKEVHADASSGGNITITARESLKADVSSGGDIDVYGDPEDIHIDESSGGDVDHEE